MKAIQENVVWNWPQILKDYLNGVQNEEWTGNFKIKLNWNALGGHDLFQQERLLERRGLKFKEKLQALMEIVEINSGEMEFAKGFVKGKLKAHILQEKRELSIAEKTAKLLELEESIVLEKEETLEEHGIEV